MGFLAAEKRVVKKVRYISVNHNGDEMYTENIAETGDIRGCLELGCERLALVRKAFPRGDWGLNIEEQRKDRDGNSHFLIMDVETGEVKEQVL